MTTQPVVSHIELLLYAAMKANPPTTKHQTGIDSST